MTSADSQAQPLLAPQPQRATRGRALVALLIGASVLATIQLGVNDLGQIGTVKQTGEPGGTGNAGAPVADPSGMPGGYGYHPPPGAVPASGEPGGHGYDHPPVADPSGMPGGHGHDHPPDHDCPDGAANAAGECSVQEWADPTYETFVKDPNGPCCWLHHCANGVFKDGQCAAPEWADAKHDKFVQDPDSPCCIHQHCPEGIADAAGACPTPEWADPTYETFVKETEGPCCSLHHCANGVFKDGQCAVPEWADAKHDKFLPDENNADSPCCIYQHCPDGFADGAGACPTSMPEWADPTYYTFKKDDEGPCCTLHHCANGALKDGQCSTPEWASAVFDSFVPDQDDPLCCRHEPVEHQPGAVPPSGESEHQPGAEDEAGTVGEVDHHHEHHASTDVQCAIETIWGCTTPDACAGIAGTWTTDPWSSWCDPPCSPATYWGCKTAAACAEIEGTFNDEFKYCDPKCSATNMWTCRSVEACSSVSGYWETAYSYCSDVPPHQPCQDDYDLGVVDKPWSDFVSCAEEKEYCHEHPETLMQHCKLTCGECHPDAHEFMNFSAHATANSIK
eukprot:SAG31_NODE_4942_length_2846_cov_1.892246_1_plen_564_part_00